MHLLWESRFQRINISIQLNHLQKRETININTNKPIDKINPKKKLKALLPFKREKG